MATEMENSEEVTDSAAGKAQYVESSLEIIVTFSRKKHRHRVLWDVMPLSCEPPQTAF